MTISIHGGNELHDEPEEQDGGNGSGNGANGPETKRELKPASKDCRVCGRHLISSLGVRAPSFNILIGEDPAVQEIYPDLKADEYYIICFICVLRSMKVRV